MRWWHFDILGGAIQNPGFNQMKIILCQIIPKDKLHYFKKGIFGVRCTLIYTPKDKLHYFKKGIFGDRCTLIYTP